MTSKKDRKIFIVMPAYNVQSYIADVFERIPKVNWDQIEELVVINDASTDKTFKEIDKLKKIFSKITVIHKKYNEGYAKAQKTGFTYAIKNGAEVVVLLHSDGQYPPEHLSQILEPLLQGEAEVVQGSRILGGKALEGGMPLYKFIANRLLSTFENFCFGMNMSEYHSGYMAYSKKALQTIPFMKLSNTFHFDGEMLLMAHIKKLEIKEIPIPTRYAGETSNLKPIQYGFQVLRIIWNYFQGKYHKL